LVKIAWSSRRWPIVNTPEAQNEAGAPDFDIRHGPENPLPHHILDLEEMLDGVLISIDANGIIHFDVVVEILSGFNLRAFRITSP
jgi:hypothetical protein